MIINKSYHFLFAFLFISTFFVAKTQAQQTENQELIYLRDGSFFKGTTVYLDSADYSAFRLTGGEIVRIKRENIASIKSTDTQNILLPKGQTLKTEGKYFNLQFGPMIGYAGGGDYYYTEPGFNLISISAGYRLKPWLQLGGGVAFDIYDHEFLPVFVEAKSYVRQGRWSPYVAVQTGYGFSFEAFDNWSNAHYGGGALVHPALGVRLAGRRNANLTLEAGYRFQWGTESFDWTAVVNKLQYRRLAVRVGWEF